MYILDCLIIPSFILPSLLARNYWLHCLVLISETLSHSFWFLVSCRYFVCFLGNTLPFILYNILLYVKIRWQWHSKVNISQIFFSNKYLLMLYIMNKRYVVSWHNLSLCTSHWHLWQTKTNIIYTKNQI